jgi:hypothetical protein
MLGEAVDEALDEFPQHGPDRNPMIAHLIQALERDSNWVELYGITGELKVPASDDGATPKEVLARIREVGYPRTAPSLRKDVDAFHSADPRKGQAWSCEELSLARDSHSS